LITRGKGKVPTVTAEGELLYETVSNVLTTLEKLPETLRTLKKPTVDKVAIGAENLVTRLLLPSVVNEYYQVPERLTRLQFVEVEGQLAARSLALGHIDMAIATESDASFFKGFAQAALKVSIMRVLITPIDWNPPPPLTKDNLQDNTVIPLASLAVSSVCLVRLEELAEFLPMQPGRRLVFDNYSSVEAAVRAGLGAGIVPALCSKKRKLPARDQGFPGLYAYRIDPDYPIPTFKVWWKRDNSGMSLTAKEFLELLKAFQFETKLATGK
jgi:DNA-binding transcriptional LysR family regulator